jgi:hypothetical protein
MAMNDHVVCNAARRSLRRAMTTYPMPCNMTANGSSVLSAPLANTRVAMCAATSMPSSAMRNGMMVAGIDEFLPSEAST